MNIIRKAKDAANKRSIDAYGRSVELAIANHLLETGTFPTDINSLTVEYTGKKVVCNIMNIKKDGGLYLSQCSVNNVEVKDSKEEDGYYHYGTRDLTNKEIIDMYASSIKNAIKDYYDKNNVYPTDISELTLDYTGEAVSCDVEIYGDGAIYMTKCSISGIEIKDDTADGYYHYGTKRVKLLPLLLSKTNDASVTSYTDGNNHEMYTFNHPATVQTEALTDYRYIGNTPNNYVTFNNELWRIIGVFTVEDENGNKEQKIKIVRNDAFTDIMQWSSSNKNDWTTATLKDYLNGDYYDNLDSISQSMITNAKYYLGGSNIADNTAEGYYEFERGNSVISGRDIYWVGKISLMYPSDYIYTYANGVDSTCYTNISNCSSSLKENGWIYNNNNNNGWLLSPDSNVSFRVFIIFNNGNAGNSGNAANYIFVRPTLYLLSSVNIDSGDGTEQSPYQLRL